MSNKIILQDDLTADEMYIQNNTELTLNRILADQQGNPAVYALGASGPALCRKIRGVLPDAVFCSIEANGVEIGLSGIVQGLQTCGALFGLLLALKEARHGN
ncbi:hypothetical protein [Pseudodesulfovibrio indicus]|uniref:Uncharacterized protein n=1 Tax=Pseudodesulfovibrio indicus TaxID=1716143 RepID=A0A140D8W0_9BACT|nr:hypothetical protein [Pseudodesulfovibrio indicus]AMK09627.1 hypothetical protein AWY79_00140 [Pseudodesulfovibrio indicus]TDT86425.1 hypothetical protein EDC59_113101 [Pseudodesulfovibrio indicus]